MKKLFEELQKVYEAEQVDPEDIERFEEIIDEIKELVDEAVDLIPRGIIKDRAESYWKGHIQGALGKEHSEYLGGSMHTMEDTLEELREAEEEEDEEEFEEMTQVELIDYLTKKGRDPATLEKYNQEELVKMAEEAKNESKENHAKRMTEMKVYETNKKMLQAAAFLKVKGGTPEEKVEFLKSKGYSDSEVMQALKMIAEGVEEPVNEAIDWKKILATAAIAAAIATTPVKGYAEDANINDLFNFLGRVVNVVQTQRGGDANVEDIIFGTQYPSGQYPSGQYGTSQQYQGYAVWGGTSNAMTCTRKDQADVGKYFKVINQTDNSEVVVKCITSDSTLGRNVVISLSRGAYAQIGDLNTDSVYVTVQELD